VRLNGRADVLEHRHESMRLGSSDRMGSAHDEAQGSVNEGGQRPLNSLQKEEDASVEGDNTLDKVAKQDRNSGTPRMELRPLKSTGLRILHLVYREHRVAH
jgi:hypothetical protein